MLPSNSNPETREAKDYHKTYFTTLVHTIYITQLKAIGEKIRQIRYAFSNNSVSLLSNFVCECCQHNTTNDYHQHGLRTFAEKCRTENRSSCLRYSNLRITNTCERWGKLTTSVIGTICKFNWLETT